MYNYVYMTYKTINIYNRKLDCFLHTNSLVGEISKTFLICSNLSERNRLGKLFNADETLTSAVNNALTGL